MQTEHSYSAAMKQAKFVMNMLPVLNTDALFSDESENFVTPMEPEAGQDVTIRVRTGRANVDEAVLVMGSVRKTMTWEKCDRTFDYYRTTVTMPAETLSWYFEIHSGRCTVNLIKGGVVSAEHEVPERSRFRACPGFHTPDWAKGAVMYQIYVDRFRNGDPGNDPLTGEYYYLGNRIHHIDSWQKRPASMDVGNFYGGDLEGVREKLDYLSDLGVEVIYFNPLFVSPSNHKYDIQDYDHIDPHFTGFVTDEGRLLDDGESDNRNAERYRCRTTRKDNLEASNAYFAKFVEEVHAHGMKVILDGVFNHCGSFNKWLDRERIYEGMEDYPSGAYVNADSPYSTFFHFHDRNAWPCNGTYDGWWDHSTLPKLNYEGSQKLVDYILHIAAKWVSAPYHADGWRLDVAADLGYSQEFNHRFWKAFRRSVHNANPDAIILAEHYGEAESWLRGDEWDTVMNYDAFMEPVTWFFTGMEKHSDEFRADQMGDHESFFGSMRYHMESFMEPSLLTSMNELSNHDHSRFLTRTNHMAGRSSSFSYDAASVGVNQAVMREAVICQMTWPGAPTIYYGDEAGLCGFTDPDNRRTYPWGHEDRRMLEFTREAIQMHRMHPALRRGSIRMLKGARNFISYARFDSRESVVAAFNNADHQQTFRVPVWTANVPENADMKRIFYTDAETFSRSAEIIQTQGGYVTLTLPPTSAIVLAADLS